MKNEKANKVHVVHKKTVIEYADDVSIPANFSSTLISYTVPYGWGFECIALFIEGESKLANQNCTFSILVDDKDTDVKQVGLDKWNKNKAMNVLHISLSAGEKLEVKIRNNHVSQSFSIRGILVGVKEPTD